MREERGERGERGERREKRGERREERERGEREEKIYKCLSTEWEIDICLFQLSSIMPVGPLGQNNDLFMAFF